MKNLTEKNALSPLHVGDVALRVRIEWRAVDGSDRARPCIVNTQAVWVVAVSADGERVTWTNGLPARDGGEYRHTSNRGELLNLEAIAEDLSPSTPLTAAAGTRELNPAMAA
jgi:hypothetical protein